MKHCDVVSQDETSVRVFNNASHTIHILWFKFTGRGSLGMSYSNYLKLVSDKTGKSLFDAKILVMK